MLSQAPELMERLDDDIDLSPLRWGAAGDRDLFLAFLVDLDGAMVEARILPCSSGLADEAVALPLWQVSGGRVRRICKIVRHAMGLALHDGRGAIDRDDLEDAVTSYCMPREFCDHNPFVRA